MSPQLQPESDNASSSSTREIKSVHEDVDSDLMINFFNSLLESHSSKIRFSNASAGSLSDTAETQQTLGNHKEENLEARSSLDSQEDYRPSPAPLSASSSPSLPPILGLSQLHSVSCSTKRASKAPSSSALPNLSSAKVSESSSASNRTPQSDLLWPVKSSPGNPPPPFLKQNNSSLKGPVATPHWSTNV